MLASFPPCEQLFCLWSCVCRRFLFSGWFQIFTWAQRPRQQGETRTGQDGLCILFKVCLLFPGNEKVQLNAPFSSGHIKEDGGEQSEPNLSLQAVLTAAGPQATVKPFLFNPAQWKHLAYKPVVEEARITVAWCFFSFSLLNNHNELLWQFERDGVNGVHRKYRKLSMWLCVISREVKHKSTIYSIQFYL